MACGIYKITNKINQKSYIGQSICISHRWARHKQDAFNKEEKVYEYPLYRAIRKYGLDNFDFSIIEECKESELNEKEQYWIQYYDTYNTGYNLTLGGDGAFKHQYNDLIQEYLSCPQSIRSIARKYNLPFSTVRRALLRNNVKIWYAKNNEVEDEFIDLYKQGNSLREIQRITGRTRHYITRIIKENGFNVKYKKPILVYSGLDGTFIEKMESTNAFLSKYGGDSGSCTKVLHGQIRSVVGYILRFYKENFPLKINHLNWKKDFWEEV